MIGYVIETRDEKDNLFISFEGSDEATLVNGVEHAYIFGAEDEANEVIKGTEHLFVVTKIRAEFEAI